LVFEEENYGKDKQEHKQEFVDASSLGAFGFQEISD
jgi:hypothetical protein